MLYQLHEMQRDFISPFTALTDAVQQLFSNPYSPLAYTPISRHIAAGYELLHRIGKQYEKPAWNLPTTQVNGQTISVREKVEMNFSFCRLIHFDRDLPSAHDPKVLLVAPLSGHYATLLRDTVKALLPNHDIYVTDWVDARTIPLSLGPFHLHDYVHYIQEFIRHLGPSLHVISVCQPTVPVLAAISLMATQNEAKQPLTMTMMGGPIDPRQSPTRVNSLATTKSYAWFEDHVIHQVPPRYPGAGRRVYPGFLQYTGFVAMNPSRHFNSHYDFYLDLLRGDDSDAQAHRRFYDEYNAVLDIPAEFYLETIRIVFQEVQLPQDKWQIDGQLVKPADIKKVALFTIEGELDDISGQGQTRAAHHLCRSIPSEHKQHYTVPGCGHYGIFSGRKWRELICPKIAQFIRAHDKKTS